MVTEGWHGDGNWWARSGKVSGSHSFGLSSREDNTRETYSHLVIFPTISSVTANPVLLFCCYTRSKGAKSLSTIFRGKVQLISDIPGTLKSWDRRHTCQLQNVEWFRTNLLDKRDADGNIRDRSKNQPCDHDRFKALNQN